MLMAGIEDRNGNRIDFARDADGHLRAIRVPDGTTFRVDTTPEGWLSALWMEGEREPLVRYRYDAAGHLRMCWVRSPASSIIVIRPRAC